jgi:ribosomal protein L18E
MTLIFVRNLHAIALQKEFGPSVLEWKKVRQSTPRAKKKRIDISVGKLMKVIYEVAYVVVDHVVLGIILIDNHAYIAIIII